MKNYHKLITFEEANRNKIIEFKNYIKKPKNTIQNTFKATYIIKC